MTITFMPKWRKRRLLKTFREEVRLLAGEAPGPEYAVHPLLKIIWITRQSVKLAVIAGKYRHINDMPTLRIQVDKHILEYRWPARFHRLRIIASVRPNVRSQPDARTLKTIRELEKIARQ